MSHRLAACYALFACLLPVSLVAAAKYDVQQELKILARGEKLDLHIPGAKYRIAAFTYEDPDGTKLGDAIAALVAREILVRSSVSSIGVLTYEGGLAPSASDGLSYFDKVEKVADAQDVTLSVWGMVRRSGSTLTVDSYLQLPPKVIEKYLRWHVKLPRSMNGELVAHLHPERVLVQTLRIPMSTGEKIHEVARRLLELRTDASDSSSVVGVLPKGSVYWIAKQDGDWMLLNAGNTVGWVRRSGYCTAECAPLLDVAKFTATLLGFMEAPGIKQFAGSLAPDALMIADQITAFELIGQDGLELLEGYSGKLEQELTHAATSGTVPAAGAALANALAIDKLAVLLQSEARRQAAINHSGNVSAAYDDLAPDRQKIAAIAFALAEASPTDPDNVDVLHNLAVLFEYAGEEKRAALARSLASKRMP